MSSISGWSKDLKCTYEVRSELFVQRQEITGHDLAAMLYSLGCSLLIISPASASECSEDCYTVITYKCKRAHTFTTHVEMILIPVRVGGELERPRLHCKRKSSVLHT